MLRHLLIIISLAFAAQAVQAAEAGKVIFVAGKAQVAERQTSEGALVQEGDMLSTGADGFIYVKTIDNGLFILRPNTRARIAAYHVDTENPANTRVKLELLSGVARSRSGDAVKLARQNFRFNTPVAAIGVRGTDFTVFTDQDMSRVAVISGAVIVSGFASGCRPEGAGPCEGTASRELSAVQRGQLLEVQRGQSAPQLMQGGALGPDQMTPPRGDEPIGKNGGVNSSSSIVSADPNLDAKKSGSLAQAIAQVPSTPVDVVPQPPVVVVEKPPVPELPERQILWGRWQTLLDQPANIAFTGPAGSERITGGNFVLFRTAGKEYVAATEGNVGFSLKNSEAYIFNDNPAKATVKAAVENGQLNVDFGKATFATSFDLTSNSEVFKMKATGDLRNDGRLFGNSGFTPTTNMTVNGALSNENGGSAAYIFQGRLDATRSTNGVTYWGR
jgi:hypothetical protein